MFSCQTYILATTLQPFAISPDCNLYKASTFLSYIHLIIFYNVSGTHHLVGYMSDIMSPKFVSTRSNQSPPTIVDSIGHPPKLDQTPVWCLVTKRMWGAKPPLRGVLWFLLLLSTCIPDTVSGNYGNLLGPPAEFHTTHKQSCYIYSILLCLLMCHILYSTKLIEINIMFGASLFSIRNS